MHALTVSAESSLHYLLMQHITKTSYFTKRNESNIVIMSLFPNVDQETYDSVKDDGIENSDGNIEKHMTSFVTSLFSYSDYEHVGDNDERVIGRMIIGFDCEKLRRIFKVGCEDYDPSLHDWDSLSALILVSNSIWKDRSLIREVIDCIASLEGWTANFNGNKILCSRYGTRRQYKSKSLQLPGGSSAPQREYEHGPLSANCRWSIDLRSTETVRVRKAKGGFNYKHDWRKPTIINNSCPTHGGLCEPCASNRVITANCTGTYSKGTPSHAIFRLLNHYEKKNT